MISVALLTEDGEGPTEMITAQTKPQSRKLFTLFNIKTLSTWWLLKSCPFTDAKESLIPLNVRVLSVGFDWAVMTWDPPTCSALDDFGNSSGRRRTTQRASPCASETYPLQYQLRYEVAKDDGTFGMRSDDCSKNR